MVGIQELPQRPSVVVGADFQQVAPVEKGEEKGRGLWEKIHTIELSVVHRTKDPRLLALLVLTRCTQPARMELRDFFGERLLHMSLLDSGKFGLSITHRTGKLFVWLCVTVQGVRLNNTAAVSQLDPPITE